jgi:[ribosomal protein S5]-alanine N-acetyltransferase
MDQKLKITLARPSVQRRTEFLAAAARSRNLHGPWTSPPQTAQEFSQYVKRFNSPTHIGFWILTESGEIAGVANISEIIRGRFRSGYLGYYAFAPHSGRGYMTEGIRAVVTKAFRSLGLHRLEANIQPGNESSRRLVQRLGFRLEGYSPRYLKIAGKWRDHERWAITAEDWAEFLRERRPGSKKNSK